MDKLDRNNTITIRINDKEKVHREDHVKAKENVNPKQNPQKDDEKNESSYTEVASENEVEESFEWVLPSNEYKEEQTVEVESSIFTYTSNEKSIKKNRGIQKLFLSVFVAVLVGSALMYVVLKTITAKEDLPVIAPISGVTDINETSSGTIAIEPFTISVVQGGVYSSKELAEKQMNDLNNQGIPAAILAQADKHCVILFASDSLEDAKTVSVMYKDQIKDAFWKEFTLESSVKKLEKEDSQKIVAAHTLFNQLAKASTSIMLSTEKVEIEKLQSSLLNVQSIQTKNPKIEEMVSSLSQAVAQVNEKTDSFEERVKIQSELLRYIVLYSKFIHS